MISEESEEKKLDVEMKVCNQQVRQNKDRQNQKDNESERNSHCAAKLTHIKVEKDGERRRHYYCICINIEKKCNCRAKF